MITSKITSTKKISEIEVEPAKLSDEVEKAFEQCFTSEGKGTVLNIKQLYPLVSIYIAKYDETWVKLDNSFRYNQNYRKSLSQIAETAKDSDDSIGKAFSKLAAGRKIQKDIEDFINVLQEGKFLLNLMRQKITGQTITTKVAVVTGQNSVYYVDESQLSYKLVLSTYGSSGNNLFSLAYKVDIDQVIEKCKSDLLSKKNDDGGMGISSSDIYNMLVYNKQQYLEKLKREHPENPDKYKLRWWDSKDTEIFELYKQTYLETDLDYLSQLTSQRYINYRKSMGGSGGEHTTATQIGDVGLVQNKKVSIGQTSVNVMRQTMIKNHFVAIKKALETMSPEEIKNCLQKLFSAKESLVKDSVTKMANEEAKKAIDLLQISS